MAMQAHNDGAEIGDQFTVDKLAQLAGMTVRNVRAYQSNGLLPPPLIRGRTGYYGTEHLDRLRLIRDMQASGFNLRAIGQILAAMPAGVAAQVLGFERSLRAAWTEEAHEVITIEELRQRFPGADTEEQIARAQRLGILAGNGETSDGRLEVQSPTMLRAAETLWRLGIPLKAAERVHTELNGHAERIAHAYVRLFLDEVWEPFVAAGQPQSDWPRIRAALEELRPLALESLQATFRISMSRAVSEAMAASIESQTGVPARG
jgi:DNA-binding transcriptional MerR regulator